MSHEEKPPGLSLAALHNDADLAALVQGLMKLVAQYIRLWNERQLQRHRYAYSSTYRVKDLLWMLRNMDINPDLPEEDQEEAGPGELEVTFSRRERLAELILQGEIDPQINDLKKRIKVEYGVDVESSLQNARYWYSW